LPTQNVEKSLVSFLENQIEEGAIQHPLNPQFQGGKEKRSRRKGHHAAHKKGGGLPFLQRDKLRKSAPHPRQRKKKEWWYGYIYTFKKEKGPSFRFQSLKRKG